jgi:hypothetical protein
MNENGSRYIKKYIQPNASEFGCAVANFLDVLHSGLYHIPPKTLKKVDWVRDDYIELCQYGGMSTFDFDDLTRLVVMAHDRHIRVEIEGAAPHYLRLIFYKRERDGDTYHRHPTMEESIERIRKSTQQQSEAAREAQL